MAGLRWWPWLKTAEQKNDLGISDCEKCMQTQDRITRQHLGCGFEPAIENARTWLPPEGKVGFRDNPKAPLPVICPGYVTRLPEVTEVVRAHRHWQKGAVLAFAKEPTEALLIGIEILDSEVNAAQHYEMTPEKDGGGRK